VIQVKKVLAFFVAVLFVFAMTSLSFAAEEKKAAPAPAPVEKKAEPVKPAEKPKVQQVTGEVKAVDTKAMTVTVTKMMKGKAEETLVTVSDKTKIMMGKEKKAIDDVKAGDTVTVKYKEVEGKKVAKSIAIHEAKPVEKKAAPAKPARKK
jgi:ribosomal protein L19